LFRKIRQTVKPIPLIFILGEVIEFSCAAPSIEIVASENSKNTFLSAGTLRTFSRGLDSDAWLFFGGIFKTDRAGAFCFPVLSI
jgi:hypothetical protein